MTVLKKTLETLAEKSPCPLCKESGVYSLRQLNDTIRNELFDGSLLVCTKCVYAERFYHAAYYDNLKAQEYGKRRKKKIKRIKNH